MQNLFQTLCRSWWGWQLVRYGLLAVLAAGAAPALASGTTPRAAVGNDHVTNTPVLFIVTPNAAPVGATITLDGTDLQQTAIIIFFDAGGNPNGFTDSGYTVNAAGTQITGIVVPNGAVTGTGTIQVNTNGGTSNRIPFVVSPSPTLSFASPNTAPVGATITLNGTDLQGTTSIDFYDLSQTFVASANPGYTVNAAGTQITGIVVPSDAGSVQVVTSGGSTNQIMFTTIYPTLTSVSPSTAPVGATITLDGNDLQSTTVIDFIDAMGNFAATANPGYTVDAGGTQIRGIVVPTGAVTGTIQVRTSGIPSNGIPFTVRAALPPALNGLSPTTAPVSGLLTLNGTDLMGITLITFAGSSNNTVSSGFTVNAAATQITGIVVPSGATTGTVTVTTSVGTSNGVAFTLTALLTITGTSPANGARAASVSGAVSASFDQAVTAGSAGALKVFSAQRGGLRTGHSGSTTASGSTVSFAPTYAFKPGETVQATMTRAATTAAGATLATGRVVQFTTAAGSGPGTFSGGSTQANNTDMPHSVAVGDVDGDGDLDLLTGGDYGGIGIVSVQLNNGSGVFGGSTSLFLRPVTAGYTSAASVVLGDVDGDGDLDFLTANYDNTVSVRLNDGSGTFSGSQNVAVGNTPSDVTVGDVDGDGDLDFLAANYNENTVSVRLNNGSGTFSGSQDVAVGNTPADVTVGDVDGDGDLDFLTANSGGTVSVRLNNGNGVFGGGSDVAISNGTPQSVAVGDVDGDGDLDFLTANANGGSLSTSTVSVRLNNGSGSFSGGSDPAVDTLPYSVVLGDIDGDGDLDLLTANHNGNTASVRLNNGSGVFGGGSDPAVGNSPISVALGDVDGDGDLDLLTANGRTVSVRLNQPGPLLSTLSPTSGPVGSSLTITGSNLTGATAVTFAGSANNTVTTGLTVSGSGSTQTLTVAVPSGAATGGVNVTTPAGVSNNLPFTVTSNPDLVVTTGTPANPTLVPTGSYDDITVDNGAVAQFTGNIAPTGNVLVQTGGTLLTNCRTLTGPGNFTLQAGATLGICDPDGLDATAGAILMTGTLSLSTDARYLYNGTAPQITGNELPALVRDLTTTNNQPLTLTQPLSIDQTLTLGGAGNFVLNGQPLTLVSDATGTALVVNSGTGFVSGATATVLRYLTTTNLGYGYRQYSSPVHGNFFSDLGTAGYLPTFNPTGYNGSATSNNASPFPTVFGYDQSRLGTALSSYTGFDQGWYSPSATDLMLTGRGYTVNLPGTQTEGFTGILNTGPYPLALARGLGPDAGWALVGNPYPAPLDWSLVAPADRLGLDASMYVFESSSPYGGMYRAYTNGLGGNPLIGSSQSFFVRVSLGQPSGALTFRNAQRLTSFGTQVAVRRGTADPRPTVQLALAGAGLSDALYLYAEAGATAGLDAAYDAAKLANPSGLGLATLTAAGQALAIDGRADFATATAVPLALTVPAAGAYTLSAASLANLAGTRVELVDNATGTRTLLAVGAAYAFRMAGTTAPGRFWLNLTAAGTLATAPARTAQVLAYPNPAHGTLTVLRPAGPAASGALLNSLGQVVRTVALPTAETTLDLRGLATGVYTLRLTVGGQPVVQRVVLN